MQDVLINDDCLHAMNDIPDRSIDMVLCDLPYGVLNRSNPAAKWDSIIPFDALWKQYLRICKPNAAIVLFGQGMFTAKLMMSMPKLWRYNLIWDKTVVSGFLNANRMPLRRHEDIIIFYDKLPVYNPQMYKGESHPRGSFTGDTDNCYGEHGKVELTESNLYFPTSILSFRKIDVIGKAVHPTQKPVPLLQYLIRTYTNKGGVVLDNTMGSGSTCVAAIIEHRHYIGIEKEKKYFDIARRRVHDATIAPTISFPDD